MQMVRRKLAHQKKKEGKCMEINMGITPKADPWHKSVNDVWE